MRILSSIVLLCVCGVAADRGQWSAFRGTEYYISPSKRHVLYDEAKRECKNMDSNLAKVDTVAISKFLRSNVQKGSGTPYAFFIGLTSPFKNETYVWEDGTSVTWANWKEWEPNNFKSETYVIFGSEPEEYREDFSWNNLDCSVNGRQSSQRPGFICQKTLKEKNIRNKTNVIVSTTAEYSTSSIKRRREYLTTTAQISVTLTSTSANHDNGLVAGLIGAVCGFILGILATIVMVCLCRKRSKSGSCSEKSRSLIGANLIIPIIVEYVVVEDYREPKNHHPSQSADDQPCYMNAKSESLYANETL